MSHLADCSLMEVLGLRQHETFHESENVTVDISENVGLFVGYNLHIFSVNRADPNDDSPLEASQPSMFSV